MNSLHVVACSPEGERYACISGIKAAVRSTVLSNLVLLSTIVSKMDEDNLEFSTAFKAYIRDLAARPQQEEQESPEALQTSSDKHAEVIINLPTLQTKLNLMDLPNEILDNIINKLLEVEVVPTTVEIRPDENVSDASKEAADKHSRWLSDLLGERDHHPDQASCDISPFRNYVLGQRLQIQNLGLACKRLHGVIKHTWGTFVGLKRKELGEKKKTLEDGIAEVQANPQAPRHTWAMDMQFIANQVRRIAVMELERLMALLGQTDTRSQSVDPELDNVKEVWAFLRGWQNENGDD